MEDIFLNRELSWLKFNERVLEEVEDFRNPLFERIRFLSITASNLDEFFMVRIASLKDMCNAGYDRPDLSGMTPEEQLDKIYKSCHRFVEKQYHLWKNDLLEPLRECGLRIIDYKETSEEEKLYLEEYFLKEIYPVLTPMAIDTSRPFPLIRNKTLNIVALIRNRKKKTEEYDYATVQVPSVISRLVILPGKKKNRRILLLENLIEAFLPKLFLNHEIVCSAAYRIMRNADYSIDEEDAQDLLKKIEKQLKRRQWGEVIRFDYIASMDERLLRYLKKQFRVHRADMYPIDGPLDLTFLMKCYGLKGFKKQKQKRFHPALPQWMEEMDIFERIKQGDFILHHPYDSFDPVTDFIRIASEHKDVLAIKQTLYRVSGNSPIIQALIHAAENGKEVTVLVELKARFDEENNIHWAKKLEKAGAHVIYGLVGLKTHCKIALVVKREEDGIRRYVHMSTGNYNDTTAKQYTDIGMFTCRESFGEDASALFNMLSGYSEPICWNHLILSPKNMRDALLRRIEREITHARSGEEAYIYCKCNALCDREIMEALYQASGEGVKIQLIVRGICCLIPDRQGLSDKIHVRSLVGPFLEHARIYMFGNGGEEEILLGSADMMPRNLEKRVEILFPVLDPQAREKVRHIMETQRLDNVTARIMDEQGDYHRARCEGQVLRDAQRIFCQETIRDIIEESTSKEDV